MNWRWFLRAILCLLLKASIGSEFSMISGIFELKFTSILLRASKGKNNSKSSGKMIIIKNEFIVISWDDYNKEIMNSKDQFLAAVLPQNLWFPREGHLLMVEMGEVLFWSYSILDWNWNQLFRLPLLHDVLFGFKCHLLLLLLVVGLW